MLVDPLAPGRALLSVRAFGEAGLGDLAIVRLLEWSGTETMAQLCESKPLEQSLACLGDGSG